MLIFDEARTYRDTGPWNTLFKIISDNLSIFYHLIIIFTSYGSPTRINLAYTLMYIKEPQMVTLVPIDHRDGLEAAGLYLTRPEFDEIVNVREYSFHPACLDFIFKISSGHAGTMDNVFNDISRDDVSLPHSYGLQDLMSHLSRTGKSQHPKNRLPFPIFSNISLLIVYTQDFKCLSEVSLTMMRFRSQRWLAFYALLSVTMSWWMRHSQKQRRAHAALKHYFAQGWLDADKGVSKDQEIAGYFFASLLHQLFAEWKLSGQNPALSIQAPNLLEFVIQVIKGFSPSNLSYPRTVGPYFLQNLPEAQYRDEFYRCCYDLTSGSLTTLSQFGTEDGQVDFYIPFKKWGIMLLRD